MSDKHSEEYNEKRVEEAERSTKLYEQTIAMLQTEERFVNFFKSYNKQSIEGFIKYYAQQKAYWYASADGFYNMRMSKESKWRHAAVELFKEIFLKKLFNIKCRWVAGEMDLPGIAHSHSFDRYEIDPCNCSFVEPITAEEFNCYMQFLEENHQRRQQEDGDDYHDDYDDNDGSSFSALHFYHKSRSDYSDPEYYEKLIPRWYRHYDAHFGTAPLMKLSTIRMDIELDWHEVWVVEIHRKSLTPEQLQGWTHLNRQQKKELRDNPEKEKAHQEEQSRLYEERKKKEPKYVHLSVYDREMMRELVSLIETTEVKKFWEANRAWHDRHSNHDMIDSTLIYLEEAKEYVPVESHDDYRIAIRNAYRDYSHKMKMETLPLVFEHYCECIRRGKPFDWKTKEESGYSSSGEEENAKRLLAARKVKGQPENFDFLKKENLFDKK